MSFVVMVALLFCSETLGSHSERRVLGDMEIGADYGDYGEREWKADPLTPVNLRVDSVSSSSDSCNLTVTCSTNYADINSIFKCDNQTCYQDGGEQTEAGWSTVSLHVYLSDGSIICNHSNKVNWTKDVIEIGHFCPQNAGSECFSDGVSICMVKTVVFSVGLIIMVFAVISVHLIEKLQKQN